MTRVQDADSKKSAHTVLTPIKMVHDTTVKKENNKRCTNCSCIHFWYSGKQETINGMEKTN